MEAVKNLLPFLEQYPVWFRAIIAAWLLFTVSLAAMFLFVPRSTGQPERPSKTDQTTSRFIPDSHHEAVRSDLLRLDCRRYRAEGHPNISTAERRICEVLAELRDNMAAIARLREVLYGAERELPSQPVRYGHIKSFVEGGLSYEDYGPRKERLLVLIQELESASSTLKTIRSPAELKRWDATGPMTIDDLFIGNGFLEWLVGYGARKLAPSEFFRLGPFFDRAFEVNAAVAVRTFRHPEGTPSVAYLDVLSVYD